MVNKTTVGDVESFAEFRFFSARLVSTKGTYTIQEARLTWGKWIATEGSHEEIASPFGKTFSLGNPLSIVCSGRQNTPTGTEGYVKTTEKKLSFLSNFKCAYFIIDTLL